MKAASTCFFITFRSLMSADTLQTATSRLTAPQPASLAEGLMMVTVQVLVNHAGPFFYRKAAKPPAMSFRACCS